MFLERPRQAVFYCDFSVYCNVARYIAGAPLEQLREDLRNKKNPVYLKKINLDRVVRVCDSTLRVFIYAKRDIAPFELLYYDYFGGAEGEASEYLYQFKLSLEEIDALIESAGDAQVRAALRSRLEQDEEDEEFRNTLFGQAGEEEEEEQKIEHPDDEAA